MYEQSSCHEHLQYLTGQRLFDVFGLMVSIAEITAPSKTLCSNSWFNNNTDNNTLHFIAQFNKNRKNMSVKTLKIHSKNPSGSSGLSTDTITSDQQRKSGQMSK